MEQIRADIQEFKYSQHLDKVIVLWTANTERLSEEIVGLNDTAESLLTAIEKNAGEVSPSTLFAVASILEKVSWSTTRDERFRLPSLA